MTINDVDVSGCEFYDNGECSAQQQFAEGELLWIEKCNDTPDCYYKQLQRTKQELQKFQDMAKKGLEEFKDVGGCWGCGLQLQLNQDIEDFKQLKAENERLKEESYNWRKLFEQQVKFNNKQQKLWVQRCTENHNEDSKIIDKYHQTLQEIKAIAESAMAKQQEYKKDFEQILDLITKAESEEE